MNTNPSRSRTSLRIVLAIAGKDIVDGFKNKTILSNIIIIFFLMVAYKWMPALYRETDRWLIVYDEGDSRLVAELENDSAFDPLEVESWEEFVRVLDDADVLEMGVVIPADFDQRLDSGSQPELEGFVMWHNRFSVDELQLEYEQQMSEILGQPVSIEVADPMQFQPDSMGTIVMVAMTLVIVVFMAGVFTVPHLMIDEKQTKTLDAMLVSPARSSHVVLGKALTGVFYCLFTSAAALVINWTSVTNWGLIIVGLLSAVLFSVALGLLLGVLLDNRQQMMVWAFIPANILLLPAFLSVLQGLLPEWLRGILPWVPTVAQAIIFRYSCTSSVPMPETLIHLGVVLASAILLLLIVVWKVQRSDRV